MKTVKTKVYQFKELSDEAKEKAIEDFRKKQWEFGEYLHFFGEYCQEQAKERGFNDIELQYSLSWSQGDGLSFKCENFDIEKFVNKHVPKEKKMLKRALIDYLFVKITGNTGHYCYASKSDIDLYMDASTETPNIDKYVETLRIHLEDEYLSLCKELEKSGYDEIEYQDSDKAIIETIEANEYEFEEDGSRF